MTVKMATKEIIIAERYNNILINLKQDRQSMSFLTKNVWFIPHLNINLLSITELKEDKITVFFNILHLSLLLFWEIKYLDFIKAINWKYWLLITGLKIKTFKATLIQNNMTVTLITTEHNQKLSMCI